MPTFAGPLTGALLVVALVFLYKTNKRSSRNLPPGPRGWPLVGNVFDLPSEYPWLRFTEWCRQYGPIFHLNLAGQTVIVLNSLKVTSDLLDRRSSIYSDRPRSIVVGEIMTDGLVMPLTHYGSLWKRLRRASHESFNKHAVDKYQLMQEQEAATLLKDILSVPAEWLQHYKRASASSMLTAVYGKRALTALENPLVHKINEFMEALTISSRPGAHLVEFFPWMMRLPSWIAPWKREGEVFYKEHSALFDQFLNDVKNEMHQGTYQPSFASDLIENRETYGLSTTESSWLAGSMFAAGSHPMPAKLEVFTMAMLLYPNVQRRGQAEVDAVVGRERLPTFADRDKLPYVECIVRECLRWRTVAPMGKSCLIFFVFPLLIEYMTGTPRRTTKDDWYGGYFIPEGSTIIFNNWAMNRDPEIFPDFDEFRPERYLNDFGIDGKVPDTNGHGHGSYGFGRRICPGLYYANAGLFIEIASLLWGLNIEMESDNTGAPIVPSRNAFLDEGVVVRPKPFKAKLLSRNDAVADAIEAVLCQSASK